MREDILTSQWCLTKEPTKENDEEKDERRSLVVSWLRHLKYYHGITAVSYHSLVSTDTTAIFLLFITTLHTIITIIPTYNTVFYILTNSYHLLVQWNKCSIVNHGVHVNLEKNIYFRKIYVLDLYWARMSQRSRHTLWD